MKLVKTETRTRPTGYYGDKTEEYEASAGLTKFAWVLIGLVILAVFGPMFTVRSVEAGQVGVVTRFGDVNRTVESGLTFKLPWPIERLKKMDVRIQKQEEKAAAASKDLQDVNATLALNYALERQEALGVFKTIGVDYKNRVIIPALQESFKAVSAQYTAEDLIAKRSEVKARALADLRSRLSPYGVNVTDLNIVNFAFSDEFTRAIEAKQAAQQDAKRAQANYDKAVLDAKSQAVLQQSLTPELLQRMAIEKWNGIMPNYVGGSSFLNIPLR